MSIKWENYQIVLTALGNQIVLGKVKPGTPFLADKSNDRTNEAVAAVVNHMKGEYESRKREDPEAKKLEFTFTNGMKLIYVPPTEEVVE
ncbi:MAG: hypothetical protein AB2401_07610 [Bacillus sp. (in: firmicutes)]